MSKHKCYFYTKKKYRSETCKLYRDTERCNSNRCKLFCSSKPKKAKKEVFWEDNREREHDIHGHGYDRCDKYGPGNG